MFQGSINSFQVLGFSKNIRCHPLFFGFSLLLVLFVGGVLCFSGKAYSSESLQKLLYQETGTSEWENRGEDDTHWVYRGEQKDGLPHGQGIATHPLGATYSGGWKEGLYHGQGIFKSLNKAPSRGSFMRAKNTVTSNSRILRATAFQEFFRTTAGMVRESSFSLTDRASKGFGRMDDWWKNLSSVTQGSFSS